MAQFSSWYATCYYHSLGQYTNWKMTVASSVLSGILTLLPEILAWQTETRQKERMLQQQIMLTELSHTDKAYDEIIHLTFQLSTMGCSSCVSTVSKVLDSIDGVLRHTVYLEDGIAEVILSKQSATAIHTNARTNAECSDYDLLWKDIAGRLNAAGFPAERSLLLETKNGFVIFDHKASPRPRTEWKEIAESYSGQLGMYKEAVQSVTGRPVVGAWIHFAVGGGAISVCSLGTG